MVKNSISQHLENRKDLQVEKLKVESLKTTLLAYPLKQPRHKKEK